MAKKIIAKNREIKEEQMENGIDQIKRSISILYENKDSNTFNQCLTFINDAQITALVKKNLINYIVQVIRNDLKQLCIKKDFNSLGKTLNFVKNLKIDSKIKNKVFSEFTKFYNKFIEEENVQKELHSRKEKKKTESNETRNNERDEVSTQTEGIRDEQSTNSGDSSNVNSAKKGAKGEDHKGSDKKIEGKKPKARVEDKKNSDSSQKGQEPSDEEKTTLPLTGEKVSESETLGIEGSDNTKPSKIIRNRISQARNKGKLTQEEIDIKTKELIKRGNFSSITAFLQTYGGKISDSEKMKLISVLSTRTNSDELYLTARDLDELHIGKSNKQLAIDKLANAMARKNGKDDIGLMYYFLRDIQEVKHEDILKIVDKMVKIYGSEEALIAHLEETYKQNGKLASRVEETLRAFILMKNNQQQ